MFNYFWIIPFIWWERYCRISLQNISCFLPIFSLLDLSYWFKIAKLLKFKTKKIRRNKPISISAAGFVFGVLIQWRLRISRLIHFRLIQAICFGQTVFSKCTNYEQIVVEFLNSKIDKTKTPTDPHIQRSVSNKIIVIQYIDINLQIHFKFVSNKYDESK